MKFKKRLLSLVLAMVMLLTAVPVYAVEDAQTVPVAGTEESGIGSNEVMPLADEPAVQSAGDTIYLLAGGDFQEAGDHANSAENVTNILAQVSQKYNTMDGFLFIGDYDCETHDDATETADGITALMGAVQGKYSNLNDANSVLVQGNHDYMDSRIDTTGGHDFDGYSAYVLNEDDYPNGGGSQAGIQNLASNLKTWLNDKIGEGYSAPIFIVSHLPLAFSPRTVTQGDAKYAKYIFDVLNDASENGLNIIFMHGHDHAYGPDNYMGGEAIYLAEGDKINIAEAGSTSAWTEETLNFTYMNAGYTGYYSEPFEYVTTAGTDKLTMTVFAITDSKVTVERYSANGLYDLKSAGYDGSYSDTSVTNVSLGLPMYSAVYASPQTIALTEAEEYGTIGNYVGVTAETPADDVTTAGNNWVEITAPVPGTEAIPGSTTYKYTLDTDGINTDSAYLIVGSSDAKAMGNGSLTAVDTDISDSTATMLSQDYEWKINSSNQIYRTVGNTTYYLKFTGAYQNYQASGKVSVVTNANDATSWDISHSGNGAYSISYTYSYGSWFTRETTYYLRYNSNAFSVTSSSNTIRLYGDVQEITAPGTEATPDANGLYGKVMGNLTYNVAIETSADDALAVVKAGLDGYYYEAMSVPGSDVTGNIVDDSVLTWTLDPNYNGNVPGDYAVTIAYNGVTLGTAEVIVPSTTTYYIAEGNGLYLVDMNTTEANAMEAVKAGVTVSSATDADGTNKTAISDDDVTWNWVDTYNGADSGPYTVEILKDGTSLGTVEVKVNIKYETGINTDWTYIGETEATGGSYTYTLDTDGIDYGEENKYIIVDDNEAIVLNANSSSNGTAHSIKISGNTATLDTRDYEYHMIQTSYNGTRYELITKGDGSQYLYQESNGVRYGTRSSVKFQVNHHGNGVYDIHDIDGTNWYIIYEGGWTVTKTTSARVCLYKYTGITGGTPGGSVYALIEGPAVYTVTQGSSATKALAAVKAGITGYTATDANGTNKTELSDSDLTWKWKNTFNGNSNGSYWVEISYQGKVLGTVEVRVEPGVVNNYPEYPDEGAVKVNKTGTGVDFQSSGIAQVEISASGVPIKKGADVIVMLDTSSSMTSHTVTGSSKTRAEVLEESLKNMIAQFKTPGADGELLDIRVAIADFNGFYGENHNSSGTPYDRDAADMMSDDISYNANSEAQVYTGDHTLGAGAFIPVEDLAASYTLNYTSGTNYDYAMDAIYQMGTAIKAANGSDERDLYVIFMSDGAAMQWNYYHSQGASSLWNNWITGAWTADQLSLNCNTHAYYYDEVDHNGDGMRNEHRMANAIKGDSSESYEVIRKTDTLGTPTGETNMYMVPGLDAKMFSISFDAQADTNVTEESMDKSIASLASEQTGTTQYYYKVTTADELNNAFDAIGGEIAYAAYNARFVDQMGDDYNLQMSVSNYSVVDGTNTTNKTLTPKIEIISYDIYTRQDYLNGTITEDKIGDRKGTYTVLETVTFNADGTEAYSDQIDGGNTNILADGTQAGYVKGVIYAKTFLYNTNINDVAVDGVSIPTSTKADGTTSGSTNVLPSETFYWKLGTVQTSELAMRYYVYLEGSMEGTREGGSYPTNEYATLYYDNYLGNSCKKDTVSPVMPWKEANVSYAFYLVNENGEIIVNQTTGQTGSFANKVAVTNPVVYETVLLNNDEEVSSIDIASLGVLPEGYTLYDYNGTDGATYTVTINSNTTGSWKITSVKDVKTTYVMQYDPKDASAYSNDIEHKIVGDDYTHTVVWFAVLWKVQALPDAVVVDYGLPVDISVLTNDMFGENGKLVGVGANSDSLNLDGHDVSLASGFGANYKGKYGKAAVNAEIGKVRYSLDTMEMNGCDKFAYAVSYTGNENAGYYYDTVTVIPATTVYYEDNFNGTDGEDYITYKKFEKVDGSFVESAEESWDIVGTEDTTSTQAEDRPGKYSLSWMDANNIYGYDGAYSTMTKYSLGSARKIHVDANTYGTAEFTFYGTGFDIIALTDNTTGSLVMQVRDESNSLVKSVIVDTYYGYVYKEVPVTDENGNSVTEMQWVIDESSTEAIYQVPVMEVAGLAYGKYTVTLTATYFSTFDETIADGYDLYLDAVRIYDPVSTDTVVSTKTTTTTGEETTTNTTVADIYKMDTEGWPTYFELRNNVLDSSALTGEEVEVAGLVFIDGIDKTASFSDYAGYGPNNELYLAPGQAIAFNLDLSSYVDSGNNSIVAGVHLGIKNALETSATYKVFDASTIDSSKDLAGITAKTLNTSTDMYYDITSLKNKTVVIANTGSSGILSVTNLKVTFTQEPSAVDGVIYTNYEASVELLDHLNTDGVFDSDQVIDVTVPSAAKVGETITVTVKTTDYVEVVTVNDVAIEYYTEIVNEDKSVTRQWKLNIDCETAGDMKLNVVGYNEDGAASEPVVSTVNVTEPSATETIISSIRNVIDNILKWLFGTN